MALQELKPEEHERIHELVVTTNTQLDNLSEYFSPAYGPALLALLTYLIEKIYSSAARIEDANAVIQTAQDVGLQNWVDQEEARGHNNSEVVVDDLDEEGV
jgi:predicted DsbA family dithiol-disulfide isomerase